MSSLEERREARRRRRMEQEESESAPAEEETTSRRSRRRAEEDEAPAEAPAEDTSQEDAAAAAEAAAAEEARRQQEAEDAARQAAEEEKRRQEAEEERQREEAERERREAEAALRKIEDDKRAAEEAEKKKIEDEKRAVEEAERKKREAEERRKRIPDNYAQPCEKKETEHSVQYSRLYHNGHAAENEEEYDDADDDNAETDDDDGYDDDDEQLKSSVDTSFDNQSSPWLSDNNNKDIETESRSCLSSSREDIYDSHTDDGSLEEDNDTHKHSMVNREHSFFNKGKVYDITAPSMPDSDKHNIVKVHTSHYELASSVKEVQPQPNKKLDTPVKNFIPSRGSNLKDIQKKFEAECNQTKTQPEKRNKSENSNKDFIDSAKITTEPVINGFTKKDSNSKVEKFKEVHIQFEMTGKTSTKGAQIKTISVQNAISVPEKQLPLSNGRRSSQENLNNFSKWPPERGSLVKDLSEKYLYSATNDQPSSTTDKPVPMKSVVRRWPCAQKAEISKTKVPESLSPYSSDQQTSPLRTEIKRDVLSRWPPPPADPKQTARESISSAIAQKLSSPDLRANSISVTSSMASAAPISERWPPVSSADKETKHSTISAKNRNLREKTKKLTSKQIPHEKNNSLWSQPESISPSQMHDLKNPTLHNSSYSTNNHLVKDAAITDYRPLTSLHSLNETQSKLNDLHEEEEREEAERKKRQEEPPPPPPHQSQPVGETPLQLNQVHHIDLNEVDEELLRKRQILSERIIPLPDNLEEMSKAQLQDLCKKLHGKMAELEEEVYDWEFKLRRQEFEINDLTLKVNDTRGKFVKPVLRKISKTEAKLAKFEKTKKDGFRTTLKSSGHKHDKIDEEEAPAEEA